MPQQKPVDDWEDVDDWQDVSTPAPNTPAVQPVEEPEPSGFFSRAWHAVSDPLTDAPSRFARSIGDYIDQPSLATSPTGEGGIGDYLRERAAMVKGFGAGAMQGVGDLVSGFTSPLNIATTLATGGASTAAKAGLPQIARGLSLGSKALAAPVILHGAGNVLSPESTLAERGQGLVEMAGGGAAALHTPSAKPVTAGTVAAEN